MEKPIVRDAFFLNQKSAEATKADLPVAQDLEDTLRANRDRCVGMAANMIGYRKNIIIVATGFADIVMINPVITDRSEPYEAEEGCLSLPGTRKTTRSLWASHSKPKTESRTQRKNCIPKTST